MTDRWKKEALEVWAKSVASAQRVEALVASRAGAYSAIVLRTSLDPVDDFWVCHVLGEPGWETEPLKNVNITGEALSPGDVVLIIFQVNEPQTGYILAKLQKAPPEQPEDSGSPVLPHFST